MEDENEYKKLPTDEKCVHKLWKARVAGYEEAIKLFNQIDDEKSPEWNKYLGLIKKFVTDSNAVAQEKGLEAALVFVENCGHAGKTTGEVMSGIVAKCIAAPKTKTKDLALQVTLMYVEIEKHEVVEEELIKGMEQKNPKVVAACIAALNTALKQFGNKVVAIKPMVKKIPILLADRDKNVRDEMKALVIEMHRWIGPAIEPHIASLQAVVQQELRESFSGSGGAQPTRYLRSQQHLVRDKPTADATDGADDDDDGENGAGESAEVDPYDLMDPVEILSKIPKDFYEKLEAKKWSERKEALDALEALLKAAPRLEPGDYADLVRALKKIISKDTNVMLVALGGKLLGMVASGLRNKFSPYATACVQAILEKFKEKKSNVVTALREAIDAIYPCTNLEAISEDMLAAFDNKNPSIKAESALFLARALCHTQPAAFNKKLIKAYVAGLLKLLESADPVVRDAAAEALGTATKLVGEKNIAPHIGKLDNLKEQKIKEFADKAEIKVKVAAMKKEAKPKAAPKSEAKPAAGSTQPKPVKRPASGAKKPAPGKKAPSRAQSSPPREPPMSQEEAEARAEALLPPDVLPGLSDSDWKSRLAAVQSFHSAIQGLSTADASAQLLYRVLNKKPGLKDTNVQVLKARLEACKYITENFPVSSTATEVVIQDIVCKLAESGCGTVACDCLWALADACGLEPVATDALAYAMDSQKNPKVQAELFNWLSSAITEYGFTMNVKCIVSHAKKALSATNPNVRTSTVNFLGKLSMYVGPSLVNYFDGEKAATKQLISLEIDKYANSTPPTPTRQQGGVSKSASKGSLGDDIEEGVEDVEEEPAPVEDVRPRTDIAPLITEALVAEMSDKNWKVRNEALDKVKAIISNSSPIKATLGELPAALVARLLDSNSKLAQTALTICEQLAVAMGARCKQHFRTFFPPFFQAFGDSKAWIRTAAAGCAGAWCREAGGAAVFDGEMVHDALKTGSPVLRATLLLWLAERLPDIPPKSFPREELSVCLPILFACLEDRAADVRKASADCVLPFMLHLGYEAMHKQMDKVKPASKTVVQAALDKARPFLPVQPLPAAKSKKDEPRGVKSAGALKKEAEKKGGLPPKNKIVKPASASSRGKKEEEDFTPLLPSNNAKNQRIIDDQKLKVLKWNFTTPREEFFDLLKEQMNSAGLNKQLVANMFHSDFRYHLKAIEALSEDLHENGSALMANLDLVLKWLTLRFFDTNPSVILKGLEYLALVFQYLIDVDYTMAEYEANCFIPYLVLKVGDPKDTVRNGVKALFKQICVVYSVTKLFGYLMEGLKSKNARQRAECLECINHLLETYGSSVTGSGPGGGPGPALRELARLIGDRDNAVRSAALNCVATAYFLDGERVYKMIGQISDKDLSLLEERIKRAGKSRSAEERRSMVVPLSASGRPIQQMPEENEQVMSDNPPVDEYEEEEVEERPPPPVQPSIPEPKVIKGPFGLDPDLIAKLDAAIPVIRKPDLSEVDLKFLDEPVPVSTVRNVTAPTRPSMVTMSPPRLPAPHAPHPLVSVHTQKPSVDDSQLADTIHSIASPDLNAAVRALSLVSGALVSGRGAALRAHEARLVEAVTTQLRRLRTSPPDQQVLAAYKFLVGALTTFYDTAGCGGCVGESALRALLRELLLVLGAGGGAAGTGPDAERLVRILNNVCVRVLEHSPRTALLCAIVSLLHDSIVESDPAYPRYQDLLLKCFWKTLKMISTWDVNSIDYDEVLYKIHLFYKAYPNSYWKKNPDISDTPYRTVKTLVHTLVKIKGSSITNHLSQISDLNESDLYPYLQKVLKQLKLDERKDPADVNGTPAVTHTMSNISNIGSSNIAANRLPRAVHEELALILKRIGSKEHNRDALAQLYDLRERHPEVDIWTFMQGSSFYFRNYVERGLRDVAEQRRLGAVSLYKSDYKPDNIDISNENDEKSHVIFLERLRALQAKAGLKSDSSPSSQPRTPVADNRALTDVEPRPLSIDPQLELHTTQSVSQRNEADVDVLRLKLQQIKSSSKR
ncbi:protein mini spindles isoform X2 [Aricia agestis]|uniref:protein mini spindles isoform X2 n=1 Tax=Aricia agestis TaxID=91739 RepID=UPI001C201B7B|nr:protein mini spindles isoform X2 [Aricia agestis]